MMNEIKISPSESLTNPKDIANNFNKHFIEIGRNLASEIPNPSYGKNLCHFLPLSLSFKGLKNLKS